MAHDSVGTKNQPQYASTGTPSSSADLSEVANYAAKVGNRKADTSSVRTALTGADVWDGLEFYETDTESVWVYQSGTGWVLWEADTGWQTSVISFAAGWSSYTGGSFAAVAARKITTAGISVVYLRGVPQKSGGPAAGETMFTLGAGYVPSDTRQTVVILGTAVASATIATSGAVSSDVGNSSATVSLGPTSFTTT